MGRVAPVVPLTNVAIRTAMPQETSPQQTPLLIIALRHLVGLGVAALAAPEVFSGGGAMAWSAALVVPLAAAIVTTLLALFFTRRTKERG